jgi:DNA-binding transcriptional LysR family regulator
MSFTQFRAFHAVPSENGITRDAARLGISQPAVSGQLRALEQACGVELFHRRGQKVELADLRREPSRPRFEPVDRKACSQAPGQARH